MEGGGDREKLENSKVNKGRLEGSLTLAKKGMEKEKWE